MKRDAKSKYCFWLLRSRRSEPLAKLSMGRVWFNKPWDETQRLAMVVLVVFHFKSCSQIVLRSGWALEYLWIQFFVRYSFQPADLHCQSCIDWLYEGPKRIVSTNVKVKDGSLQKKCSLHCWISWMDWLWTELVTLSTIWEVCCKEQLPCVVLSILGSTKWPIWSDSLTTNGFNHDHFWRNFCMAGDVWIQKSDLASLSFVSIYLLQRDAAA